MDRIKSASWRQFRTQGLHATPVPIPYDPEAMPGSVALGIDGRPYQSLTAGQGLPYKWCRVLHQNADGILVIGDSPERSNFSGSLRHAVQLEGSQVTDTALGLVRNSTNSAGSGLAMCKTRSATTGGNTMILPEDLLGSISFQGADGDKLCVAATLRAFAEHNVGLNTMPGRFVFSTTPKGAQPFTPGSATNWTLERMRLTSDGNLLINNTTGTEKLSVTGNIQVSSSTYGFMVGTNKVVGGRRTGWAAGTGNANRSAFATSTVTLPELAERVKALIDDCIAHGLIGA